MLEHKDVKYEYISIIPPSRLKMQGKPVPIELDQASPLGKIPAIIVPEGSIADSAAIAVYLEKKYPNKPLYPASPYLAAKAVWFEQYAGSEMGDVFGKIYVEKVLKPSADEKLVQELQKKIPQILQYLDKSLGETNTQYLVTDELSIGDIAVLHQFVTLQTAKVPFDLTPYVHLKVYLDRGLKHPSIQAVLKKM